jgi:hypothetical protein
MSWCYGSVAAADPIGATDFDSIARQLKSQLTISLSALVARKR